MSENRFSFMHVFQAIGGIPTGGRRCFAGAILSMPGRFQEFFGKSPRQVRLVKTYTQKEGLF